MGIICNLEEVIGCYNMKNIDNKYINKMKVEVEKINVEIFKDRYEFLDVEHMNKIGEIYSSYFKDKGLEIPQLIAYHVDFPELEGFPHLRFANVHFRESRYQDDSKYLVNFFVRYRGRLKKI